MDAAEPAHERREIILGRLTDKAARRGLRIAQDLLRNPAEAEDAVQDALARACEACDRLRDLAPEGDALSALQLGHRPKRSPIPPAVTETSRQSPLPTQRLGP